MISKKNSSSSPSFIFFSFAAHGSGISGGDRIFIELARRWQKSHNIDLYVFEDGQSMCKRNNLDGENIVFKSYSLGVIKNLGFVASYITKIIVAIYAGFTLPVKKPNSVIIYSSSEFWMDSLPAYILKKRFPSITWVASWYQTAPNPLKGFSEGNRKNTYRFKALIYFLVQFPVKRLISSSADFVLVNNVAEKQQFPLLHKNNKAIVLLGAVDTEGISTFRKNLKKTAKLYDAVFQGRFHPQKGVVELIEIWKLVVKSIPKAQLVMIGDGPLMHDVLQAIKKNKLHKNITVKGYLFDGNEKYSIFAQSKIVLHPSFYDSGGMAAAEAMAFGLPCVGFNLKSYDSYYPKGMKKVEIGNKEQFANVIISLLNHPKEINQFGQEAEQMIFKNYSWNNRAKELYKSILK